MSAAEKAFYYGRLRDAGVPFSKHYRDYTTDDLKLAHDAAVAEGLLEEPTMAELADVEERKHAKKPRKGTEPTFAEAPLVDLPEPEDAPLLGVRVGPADPNEMAGMRQNTREEFEVIRIDEEGRQWLQEEVLKPAYPKPRGRRVLRYMDSGVQTMTTKVGDYTESFEVAGDPANARPAEIKITLPSYQVGIYIDPRFPFRVITYNGVQGFDREDVIAFYGGDELVPEGVKRIYVENVLCYDVRSTVREIQAEYRRLQLAGQA